ncbi:hypothetical protein [Paenibacillus favisporus]
MKLESCNGKKLYAQGKNAMGCMGLGSAAFLVFLAEKVGMIALPQAVFSI